MAILKRLLILGFAAATLFPLGSRAQAQDSKEIIPSDVIHCETLDDVNKAKQGGAQFFEFRNNFWVRVGDEYKGPFRYLRSAQKILNQQKLDAIKKAPPAAAPAAVPSASPAAQKTTSYYNPQMILFPFVEFAPDRQALFSIPGGLTVPASHVMIHPEPLEYDKVSFGMIDLSLFSKNPFASPAGANLNTDAQPNVPQQSAVNQLEKYFAVTGEIVARENVTMPTAPLEFWVGAAVVGKDGSLLWRQYGNVEEDNTFKCVGRLPNTELQPEFLLMFTLGKGKLAANIRTKPEIPVVDASPYDYHVLGSSILEVGPNWYPPVQAAVKEEYDKTIAEMQRKKLQDLKSGALKTAQPKQAPQKQAAPKQSAPKQKS